MSSNPTPQLPPNYVLVPVSASNGLGVAGFIVSLVGALFTAGLLCPVGLLLSLIALGRRPRGFAASGVVIGLLGSCMGLLLVLAIVAAVVAGVGAGAATIGLALVDPDRAEVTFDMSQIATNVQMRRARDGSPPASLTEVGLDEHTLTDPWKNPYRYVLTDKRRSGYDVISDGPDGVPDTDDDIALSRMGKYWDEFFDVQEDKENRTVRVKIGSKTILLKEDNRGGSVEIDLGDRVMHLIGGNQGRIMIEHKDAAAPQAQLPAPASPDPPSSSGD